MSRQGCLDVGESGGPHALVHFDHRLLGGEISTSGSVEVAVYVIRLWRGYTVEVSRLEESKLWKRALGGIFRAAKANSGRPITRDHGEDVDT